LEDAIHASESFVELDDTGDYIVLNYSAWKENNRVLTSLVLIEANLESLVVDDAVDVAGDVVQDLKRQVTKRLLGALDPLARV
jgi:hypothetical protein